MNLVANNLTYKPNHEFHLNDISFNFKKGNLYTILGRTLSGKTTLLKTIAGLLNPDSGVIHFEDKEFSKIPVWQRNVAMVYQQFINYPHLNVYENISFPLKQRKLDENKIKNDVNEALKTVGLIGFENRKIQELSGGQQQRVALARALIVQPRVLLLDEPLSNLDAHLRFEMRDLIRNLQQSMGITTIFVTHDQEEAVVLADQVALILDGKLKQYAQPDVFYKKPIDVVTAKFFGGQNFIKGTSKNNNFSSNIGKLALPKDCLQGNGILTFRPENVQIGKGPKSVNTIKAKIIEKIFLGTQTRLKLSIKDEVIQAIANPNEVDEKETGIEIDINIPPSSLWVINN